MKWLRPLSEDEEWITLFFLAVYLAIGMVIRLVIYDEERTFSLVAFFVSVAFAYYFNSKIKKKQK